VISVKQIIKQLLGVVVILLVLAHGSYAQLAPPLPYYGNNPSASDIRAIIVKYSQQYQVPAQIVFGMAQQESGWRQYSMTNDDGQGHGRTIYHQEPKGNIGVGIMQITVYPSDPNYERLCKDIDYNIQRGVAYLADPNNRLSCWRNSPIIGDNDRGKLENWFYAIWTYNGLDSTITSRAYPDTILGQINNCQNGQWVSVRVTAPTSAQTNGHHTILNTPLPYHVDADFDGVIDGSIDNGSDTDIWVDGGFGGTQTGTQANPYSTVKAAVDRASATQAVVIHIKAGTYSEKIGTPKHIQFVTNGPGTVRIGG